MSARIKVAHAFFKNKLFRNSRHFIDDLKKQPLKSTLLELGTQSARIKVAHASLKYNSLVFAVCTIFYSTVE